MFSNRLDKKDASFLIVAVRMYRPITFQSTHACVDFKGKNVNFRWEKVMRIRTCDNSKAPLEFEPVTYCLLD